jgi:hypothetical protein
LTSPPFGVKYHELCGIIPAAKQVEFQNLNEKREQLIRKFAFREMAKMFEK